MKMSRFLVSSAGAAVVGLLLLSPSRAVAQGTQTVSACCSKVCNADGSSTRCKPLLLGGLGSAPMSAVGHGCLDLETAPRATSASAVRSLAAARRASRAVYASSGLALAEWTAAA